MAYKSACDDICNLALKRLLKDREDAIASAIEDIVERAFASGVLWAIRRNPSSEDEALLEKKLLGKA